MQTEPNQDQENEFHYDEEAAVSLVDKDQVVRYFQTIFGEVKWNDDTHLCLRGIGEKELVCIPKFEFSNMSEADRATYHDV